MVVKTNQSIRVIAIFDVAVPQLHLIMKSGFTDMFNVIIECPTDGEPSYEFLNKIAICDKLGDICPDIRERLDLFDPK
tara:strand:- start:1183 stop:1416 length:234 start_codon:yes stop_codon:yes gene_type:complete